MNDQSGSMRDPSGLTAEQERIIRELSVPPAAPSGHGARLQCEAWEEGPLARMLVVAQGPKETRAWVVSHDERDGVLSGGSAMVAPATGHHDRDAILAGIELAPLQAADMRKLGLLKPADEPSADAPPASLAGDVAGIVTRTPPHDLSKIWTRPGMGKTAHYAQMAGRMHRAAAPAISPTSLGYASGGPATALAAGRQAGPIQAPGTGHPPTGVTSLPDLPDLEASLREVAPAIYRALAALRARHAKASTDVVGPVHWTPRAYAFYAAPGRRGERRRQAGRLYPAFAPLIAADPATGEAIDAGRPFEAALCAALGPVSGRPPSVAGLRRLRALPATTAFEDVVKSVGLAAALPHDWLPAGGPEIGLLVRYLGPYVRAAERLGLAPATVFADAEARRGGLPLREGRLHPSALEDAKDMAERFRDTLLVPALATAGREIPRPDRLRIAGAVLFGGKELAGIRRLERSWHEALGAFEAALPTAGGGQEWPEAFPPLELPDGIEVACLTTDVQLRAEGSEALDANGVPGLDHCVGGYGRKCYSGESIIASIRRRLPDGGYERLSTVEFAPEPGGWGAEGMDRPGLALAQHLGEGNAMPPTAAVEALAALRARLADGHPLDPAALGRRDPAGYRDAYDWRVPGAVGQALAAWSGFLPRDVTAGGIPALLDRVAAVEAALPPPPPPAAEAPRVVVVDHFRPEPGFFEDLLRRRAELLDGRPLGPRDPAGNAARTMIADMRLSQLRLEGDAADQPAPPAGP